MNARTGARYAGLMAAALAVASLNALAAQEKGDAALDGKWRAVAITERGKEKKDDAVQLMAFEFKAGKMTLSMLDKSKSFTFRPDPSKTPKQFDMQEDERPRTLPGIYKIEKDTLTFCFDPRGDARPQKFEAPEGSPVVLVVLKRGEGNVDPKAAKEAIEKVREAADRATSLNNLKQIALAFHGYHDTRKTFPPHAIYSKDGKPLLSWRVALLPYIEQAPLHREFKLDEPWDSEHNKKLLATMPPVYAPVRGQPKEAHSTHYQVFTGPGTLFDGPKGIGIGQVRDGTSNTVLVVEAADAVPWTKPQDLPYDAKAALPKLGGMFQDVFHLAFADGAVRSVQRQFDADLFRLLITPNDGKEVNPDKLSP